MKTHVCEEEWFANDCPAAPTARVLLADPDPISRHVLATVLRRTDQLRLVATVDIAHPPNRWPLAGVDVAILAVGPNDDHARAVQQLTARHIRVLLLGIGWTRARLDAAFASGAGGCLVKDTRLGGLVPATRAVAAGHTVLSPDLLALYRSPARSARPDTVPLAAPPPGRRLRRLLSSLTDREREVLTLLSGGFSTAEAAHSLKVSPATVKSHVSHSLAKLGVRNRVEAVLLVQRVNDPRQA
ncbi:LuxR C-terminal-related transcriptional regulator [Kitasatospora sp. McL0602]|uniref:LuxR C-terminal-related transcriptional regulator n=1 Tax=Kitasatospora sp. McL0602 TaxID=3439530 RepID=UPI003F8CA679